MTPARWSKLLSRRMAVSWREHPTQTDIEALDANIARVGLVIRVRWAIVAALGVFSVAAAAVYAATGVFASQWYHMVVPAFALALVLGYNAYYQANYRRFGNVALFNMAQLLADILVVTVLIYYSGGVYSWFDSMYLLFVLEAALILPTRRQVWAVAAAAAVAYAAVLALEYTRVLPHTSMPFVANNLHVVGAYVAVRALWTFTVIAGVASVGTLLMDELRRREDRLISESETDPLTGLFNRSHFRRELEAEIERSKRYGRGVSVLLVDVDDLERFNAMFGYEGGNRMLRRVAEALQTAAAEGPAGEAPLVVVSRYGGEEFALLVPEDASDHQRAGGLLAERVRVAVESARDVDRSVTVSIGVATFPGNGGTAAEVIGAADAALSRASEAGGDRVVVGRGSRPVSAGD